MRTSLGSALEPMKRFFSRSAPPVHTASTRRHSSFGIAKGGVEYWGNRKKEKRMERAIGWMRDQREGVETDEQGQMCCLGNSNADFNARISASTELFHMVIKIYTMLFSPLVMNLIVCSS